MPSKSIGTQGDKAIPSPSYFNFLFFQYLHLYELNMRVEMVRGFLSFSGPSVMLY